METDVSIIKDHSKLPLAEPVMNTLRMRIFVRLGLTNRIVYLGSRLAPISTTTQPVCLLSKAEPASQMKSSLCTVSPHRRKPPDP